jgi:hypothetical protein
MTAPTKRGRPPTNRALTIEQKIAALVAAGYKPEEIACVLDTSPAKLKVAYGDLLIDGAKIARAQVISAMFGAAIDGNATAGRAFLALTVERKPAGETPAPSKPEPKEPWQRRREVAAERARNFTQEYPEWSFLNEVGK